MNTKHTRNVFTSKFLAPRKNKDVINLRNMIIPYSLIKMNAKRPPPYSMLNPDTISDSPSARSKGVRLASAMHNNIQTRNSGKQNSPSHILS